MNRKAQNIISTLLLIVFISPAVHAKSEGAVAFDDHAQMLVIYQLINVAILIGGLVYFAKKKNLASVFEKRRANFLDKFEKIQAEKKAAEIQNQEIRHHLAKLEESSQETIIRARAEAANLKEKIVNEAYQLAQRIRSEASASSELEVAKARRAIREEMIKQATALAKDQIANKVSAEDHKRLQGDFITSIKAVES